MKISIIREFVRLAENRNFSRTAEELYIAQPVLSRHIAALEDELNAKLINRSRNSFQLTEQGEIALEGFQKMLADYEAILEQLARQESIENGELHLGFLYYDRDFYVSTLRNAFHQRCPDVRLALHSYQPAQLEDDLLEGKLDAAILYGVRSNVRTDIRFLPFLKIPYTLIYPKGHRLESLEILHPSDLEGERILIPEQALKINQVSAGIESMLKEINVHIERIPVLENYDDVPWLMKESNAVYLSPMVNCSAFGQTTSYRHLFPERYSCDVSLVWRTENHNPAVRLLCSVIRGCYT